MMRPIRSHQDYEQARKRAIELAATSDADKLDELEVIYALVDSWDRQQGVKLPAATPIDAIRFRMEQQDLKPRDLEPLIGSRARVSEVFSGTRRLTLDMIRALHEHLGIPANVLIATTDVERDSKPPSAGALAALRSLKVLKPRESWQQLIARAFGADSPRAMLRKTSTDRTNAKTDLSALEIWCAAVRIAAQSKTVKPYKGKITGSDVRELAMLSALDDGLGRVEGKLAQFGIVLVILPHFPGTYLDGAAMRRADGVPVIALTLRHDRIDNFWFTLLHELGHVILHLHGAKHCLIVDDLEVKGSADMELEADVFAQDALIPPDIWIQASSSEATPEDLEGVASRAGVHPSIVAGRWQRAHSDYRRFSRLIARGTVRGSFGLSA